MDTILVGTDFSTPAANAVNYAVEVAKFFNARLIIVNAFPLPMSDYDSIAPLDMIASLQESSVQSLMAIKEEIIRKNYHFEIECVSEVGHSFGVIKDVAQRYSADLLVMGMVGEGGFLKKHLFGSSSLDAARHLTIPLFIIPENVKYHRIRQISFACDPEQLLEPSLMFTVNYFSSVFDAEIELVTVRKNNNQEVEWDKSETYSLVEKRLQNTKHKNVLIRDNNVPQALEYYLKFHKTDLVMVNPKRHGFFKTLFSDSVTRSLVFNVKVPLLIIHDELS